MNDSLTHKLLAYLFSMTFGSIIQTPTVLHKCDNVLRVCLRIIVNHIHARILRPIDSRIIMKGWIVWIIFGWWRFHLSVSFNVFACENSGVIHLTLSVQIRFAISR